MNIVAAEVQTKRHFRALAVSLRRLSDADAALVLLASREGVTYRDIAEAWGMAPSAVARRLRAALREMRDPCIGTQVGP
ncbi:MAG: sigma factor-like helix-turn-helix DNA-binding protein [Acidimicrobiia bacterium]